jgi:transcriptional regulator with GAF, ATPase, and Fis domain
MKNRDHSIIGSGAGLSLVISKVEMVGPTDLPVLLLGETGSGKEVIARAVHEKSQRRSKEFIRVNCGAISPTLIDSELFGYEKGSFTGAAATRRGWFERANGGTLFLDEIGEMPLEAQVRLLRVLQDGSFDRVGGEKPVQVDVRIIAATHRDLAYLVKEGRFRQDLWYRICGFPIEIPALRDRAQDMPQLASYFVERACGRFGLRRVEVTPAQVDLLNGYSWPGNVRELITVLERAVLLGKGQTLEIGKALGAASQLETSAPASRRKASPEPEGAASLTLDEVIRRHIEDTLERTHGRVDGPFGAARILGLNPHTLRSKLRKYGIDRARFRAL